VQFRFRIQNPAECADRRLQAIVVQRLHTPPELRFEFRAVLINAYVNKERGLPFTSTDESLLVQVHGKQVIYLSPTSNDSVPTRKSFPLDRLELAAASAVSMPGQFGRFHNYQGREVLASSQPLRSVPWVLIQAVDAREALLESSRHRRFLITSFTLLLFCIAATLVVAWWHGSSVRAIHDADALRSKTLELQKQ